MYEERTIMQEAQWQHCLILRTKSSSLLVLTMESSKYSVKGFSSMFVMKKESKLKSKISDQSHKNINSLIQTAYNKYSLNVNYLGYY